MSFSTPVLHPLLVEQLSGLIGDDVLEAEGPRSKALREVLARVSSTYERANSLMNASSIGYAQHLLDKLASAIDYSSRAASGRPALEDQLHIASSCVKQLVSFVDHMTDAVDAVNATPGKALARPPAGRANLREACGASSRAETSPGSERGALHVLLCDDTELSSWVVCNMLQSEASWSHERHLHPDRPSSPPERHAPAPTPTPTSPTTAPAPRAGPPRRQSLRRRRGRREVRRDPRAPAVTPGQV